MIDGEKKEEKRREEEELGGEEKDKKGRERGRAGDQETTGERECMCACYHSQAEEEGGRTQSHGCHSASSINPKK